MLTAATTARAAPVLPARTTARRAAVRVQAVPNKVRMQRASERSAFPSGALWVAPPLPGRGHPSNRISDAPFSGCRAGMGHAHALCIVRVPAHGPEAPLRRDEKIPPIPSTLSPIPSLPQASSNLALAAGLAAALTAASPALAENGMPPPAPAVEATQAARPSMAFPSATAPPVKAGASGEYVLPEGAQWRYSEFINAVNAGKVERVRFSKDGSQLQVRWREGEWGAGREQRSRGQRSTRVSFAGRPRPGRARLSTRPPHTHCA